MQLHQWLAEKHPSFEDGLQLLKDFEISEVKIKTIIGLKGTKLAISKMKEWLEPASKNKPAAKQLYYSKNVDVKALDDTWRRNYKIAHHIFQTDIKNPKLNEMQKRKSALEILDLFENHVDPIWRDLKHFDQHGKLPEDHYLAPAKETSVLDKIKRRNTLRTYLSKFGKDENKKDKCIQWTVELQKLENEINAAEQK